MQPTALLSIEIAARELESRLILAAALTGAGIRAIVGHKETVAAIAERSTGVVWHGWLADSVGPAVSVRDRPDILACACFGSIAHATGLDCPFVSKLNATAWPHDVPSSRYHDFWFSKWRQDTHDFAEFLVLITHMAT